MGEMTDKVVLITGASRGIGEAAVEVFVEAGARVAATARSEAPLQALVDRYGDRVMACPADIADAAQVQSVVAAVAAEWGPVDVLINNAGAIEPIARMDVADPAGWGQVIDINLKGVFYAMNAVLPAMVAAGGGTILTISSGAAHGPVEAWSHYCASKAGAAMLTRCLHKEFGDSGLRAMGLSPGTVATKMQKEIKASGINPVSQLDWSDHIPADWPAKALLWMCGAEADPWIGEEISLRDEGIRRKVGLI